MNFHELYTMIIYDKIVAYCSSHEGFHLVESKSLLFQIIYVIPWNMKSALMTYWSDKKM